MTATAVYGMTSDEDVLRFEAKAFAACLAKAG
jgi:hypothetical protein